MDILSHRTRISRELPRLTAKFNIRQFFDTISPELQQIDAQILQQTDTFDPNIRGYIEYAIESHGQRIRPALCILAAHATGKFKHQHRDLAVIVELIHLASLVHDDILDQAFVRRAQPTSHTKWGVELAVLLGDCLFAHALRLGTRLSDPKISNIIAEASNEVCMGEMMQTQRRFDLKFTIPEYLKTIEMKTAALFRVATETAALANEVPEAWATALRNYGLHLGIAYQIYDDCMDLFASEKQTGKTLGTDLAKGKFTLPILHVLNQLKDSETQKFSKMLLNKNESVSLSLRASPCEAWQSPLGKGENKNVIKKIIEYGGHRFAARKTQEHLEKARQSLNILPETSHRAILQSIPHALHQYIDTLR